MVLCKVMKYCFHTFLNDIADYFLDKNLIFLKYSGLEIVIPSLLKTFQTDVGDGWEIPSR